MPKMCMYEANILMHDALMHHGIKNQHWGVRNGPPYPLDRKTSARIKRGDNEKARVSAKEYRDMRSGKIKTTEKDKHGITHLASLQESKWKQGVNVPLLRSQFPGVRGEKGSSLASLIGSGAIDALRSLKRPNGRITDDDARLVNLGYYSTQGSANTRNDPGMRNNCGMCTAALAMRSLGWNVSAARTAGGVLNSALQYWFDGARPYKEKSAEAIERRIMSFGKRGKGEISVRHANGSGHSVFFQMERDPSTGQSKPVVYDGQIGRRYGSVLDFLRSEQADLSQFTTITRLDDARPNFTHMAEDSVIRMPGYTHANVVFNNREKRWVPDGHVTYT